MWKLLGSVNKTIHTHWSPFYIGLDFSSKTEPRLKMNCSVIWKEKSRETTKFTTELYKQYHCMFSRTSWKKFVLHVDFFQRIAKNISCYLVQMESVLSYHRLVQKIDIFSYLNHFYFEQETRLSIFWGGSWKNYRFSISKIAIPSLNKITHYFPTSRRTLMFNN